MNGDGWRFSVLGPARVWRGERELGTGAPQQRALLAAVLLRRGRAAAVEELVAALWEADPPARAVGIIRTYASRLRRVLEGGGGRPEVLVSAGTGYALRVPDAAVDAFVFEERVDGAERARAAGDPGAARRLLLEADALWGGAPLAGLPGPYAEKQRSRLTDLRFSALRARLELDLGLGRHGEVVGELTLLAHERPWDESVQGLLMLALHRGGRQAEALDVFARTRRVLGAELGAMPGPELRDLHRRILAGDPSLLPVREGVGAAGGWGDGLPGGGAGRWDGSLDEAVEGAGDGLVGPISTARGAESAPPSFGVRDEASGLLVSGVRDGASGRLPSGVPDFVGRQALVARLHASLAAAGREPERRGAPVVVAVTGPGGVGKTALAVQMAHGVSGCFPDGLLFADLGGTSRHPAEPGAVLRGFLRALGVPDAAIPEGTAARAALYRSRLADRGALVVLDDALDFAQVRPLLPAGTRCAVLVTCRARLSELPTDRRVDLEEFESGEALELLARVAGAGRVAAERDAALDVVRLCGGLPLAVRIVGDRLAARPDRSVASLASALSDERGRLAELSFGPLSVEETLRCGFDRLDDDQARAFRLLALPESALVSREVAAALLGTDVHQAEDLAEGLVDLGMLNSPAPGRYTYPGLLRLFARGLGERAGVRADRRAAPGRALVVLPALERDAPHPTRRGVPVAHGCGALPADRCGVRFAAGGDVTFMAPV